jgi:hypothetical protein
MPVCAACVAQGVAYIGAAVVGLQALRVKAHVSAQRRVDGDQSAGDAAHDEPSRSRSV